MKTTLCILLLAMLALAADLELAALGLALVAAVLLIGDQAQKMAPPPCNQNCLQGDTCNCQLASRNPK